MSSGPRSEVSQRILSGLGELRRLDKRLNLFGADGHKYHLNPPLSEQALQQFEAQHHVRLPDDYRLFLLEVGNGGAGPSYGIHPLGHMDGSGSEPPTIPWDGQQFVGRLDGQFRYTAAWNLPDDIWSQQPDDEEPSDDTDRLMEEWDRMLEPLYWAPEIMEGALPISTRGCALREWLVITGECRGTVWNDDRATHEGVYPLLGSDGAPLSFGAWYLDWIGKSLAAVR